MTEIAETVETTRIWAALQQSACAAAAAEPALATLLEKTILAASDLQSATVNVVAGRLATADIDTPDLRDALLTVADADFAGSVARDLQSFINHDPAAGGYLHPFLYYKGFHALSAYRLMHRLYHAGRRDFACYLQSRISTTCGVDIHPAATIGDGIMMDHATGIVIGETAVVENDVLFWHGVTLGGSGFERGDRHPKIRRGVMLGANATVLGNIDVGAFARVAAGSLVLSAVKPHVTVAGIPARVVRQNAPADSAGN